MELNEFVGMTVAYIILFFAVCLVLVGLMIGGYYMYYESYKENKEEVVVREYVGDEDERLYECFGAGAQYASQDEINWCLFG